MFAPFAPFVLLGPLLAAATVSDLKHRLISNRLNAVVALLASASWLLLGFDLRQIAIVIALALAVFVYFAIWFRLDQMGGGDVKLGAALVLWLYPGEVILFLLASAVAGGVVTLTNLAWHKAAKRTGPAEAPYGLALVAGALLIFTQRYLNHFA